MSFFDRINIFRHFENKRFQSLSQLETEALIEALVLAMAVDQKIDDREQAEVLAARSVVNWRASESLDTFSARVLAKAGEPDIDTALPGLASHIAARVESDWLKEEIYFLCATIAMADEEVVPAETQFLAALSRALNLSGETQRLIIQRVQA